MTIHTAPRRRTLSRLTALTTGTALALTALTALPGSASASVGGSAGALPPARPASSHGVVLRQTPALPTGGLRAHTTASGWAEPGTLTVQTYGESIESAGTNGDTAVTDGGLGAAQYRQLLDIGNISGGKGDDFLAVTASGQLRLYPASYSRPSNRYLVVGPGWQTYSQIFVVGDLNGDGRADLMARDHGGRLWYYASRSSLTSPFQARKLVGTGGWNSYDQLVGAVHFGGSARATVLARDLQGRLWAYDGHSDGTLTTRRFVASGFGGFNQLLGLDWNADGRGDVVARTEQGNLYLYQGNGAGGLTADGEVATGWYDYNALANEGHQPDFGKGEILGRYSNGNFYWYISNENGTLMPRMQSGSGFDLKNYPWMTATASMDDSGQPGLWMATSFGDLQNLYDTNGQTLPRDYYDRLAAPGDLTGDGYNDLVGRDSDGRLWLLPGDRKGGVTGSRQLIGYGWNSYRWITGSGDLNGDGVADLVAVTPGGVMYLYPGLGNGRFGSRIYVGYGWEYFTHLIATGDMTGDGKADLATVDSAGRLWLYPGLGDGRFGHRVEIGSGGWNGFHDLS